MTRRSQTRKTHGVKLGARTLGLLIAAGFPHAATAGECLDGLKPALADGGFSGSVDCERDHLSIDKVGQVHADGRTFTIYSYRYQLRPACPDCAIHGGQSIVVMDGRRYLGQYKANFATPVIRRGALVLDAPGYDPVMVEFTRDGPPGHLLVDGEVVEFFR